MSSIKSYVAVAFFLLFYSPVTQALPLYLTDPLFGFIAHYDNVQATEGDIMGTCYACNICHTGVVANATNLSGYANDWKAAWIAREATRSPDEAPNANSSAALTDIELTDSDGDTIKNGLEITGGANPGNSASTPSNTGCSTGSGSYGSSSGGSQYNANALNPKCGFQSAAGILRSNESSSDVFQEIILFLMPLMLGFLLRFKPVFSRRL